jgi:hypothetical protein
MPSFGARIMTVRPLWICRHTSSWRLLRRGTRDRTGQARERPARTVAGVQLAVQDAVGAVLVPFHQPRKPKVVLAPAARLAL